MIYSCVVTIIKYDLCRIADIKYGRNGESKGERINECIRAYECTSKVPIWYLKWNVIASKLLTPSNNEPSETKQSPDDLKFSSWTGDEL